MGIIRIYTEGSFPDESLTVSAEEGGHAFAIQRAIAWLVARQPWAIRLDHQLHDNKQFPPKSGFGIKEGE